MAAPEKKKVWMRLGIAMELTEEEIEAVKRGEDDYVILDKVDKGDFTVDGESYIPYAEGNDEFWPIENVIDFIF